MLYRAPFSRTVASLLISFAALAVGVALALALDLSLTAAAAAVALPSLLVKVCAVCFDGYADDFVHIVYCDGCSMPVHHECYGITDLEGDFYCERCLHLQELEKR